jgi:general secretion pathway protein L
MTSLTGIWTWWLDGLTDAVAVRDGKARARARVRLVPSQSGYVLEDRPGRTPHGTLNFQVGSGGRLRLVPEKLAGAARGKAVDLILSPDEALVRTLEPLPPESRAYLDGIVQHNLERVTPWRAGDVLHCHHALAISSGDPRLLTTIVATARPLMQPRIDALEALGVSSLRLIVPGAGSEGADAVIEIGGGQSATRLRKAARRRAGFGLASLAAVFGLGAAVLTWAMSRAGNRLAAATTTLAQQRSALLGSPAGARQARDAEAIWAKKHETTPVVVTLESVSAALPDDTWLTEFRIGDGRVRLTGVSRNVTALVPLIERVPGFADARFFAPTIRLPGDQGNQFHLEARLLGPRTGTGSEAGSSAGRPAP